MTDTGYSGSAHRRSRSARAKRPPRRVTLRRSRLVQGGCIAPLLGIPALPPKQNRFATRHDEVMAERYFRRRWDETRGDAFASWAPPSISLPPAGTGSSNGSMRSSDEAVATAGAGGGSGPRRRRSPRVRGRGRELVAPDAALFELAEPGLDEGLALGGRGSRGGGARSRTSRLAIRLCCSTARECSCPRASRSSAAASATSRQRRSNDSLMIL